LDNETNFKDKRLTPSARATIKVSSSTFNKDNTIEDEHIAQKVDELGCLACFTPKI
jgi:hypothetical protein